MRNRDFVNSRMRTMCFWTFVGKDCQFHVYSDDYEIPEKNWSSEYDAAREIMEMSLSQEIIPIYMGRKNDIPDYINPGDPETFAEEE